MLISLPITAGMVPLVEDDGFFDEDEDVPWAGWVTAFVVAPAAAGGGGG